MKLRALGLLALFLAGCEGDLGSDGSQLPVTMAEMSGGLLFSTAAIEGAKGYDIYWSPLGIGEQRPIQLTNTTTDDVQPSVARDGSRFVFARRGEGIHIVDADGGVRQLSDTHDQPFIDTLPAVSAEGDRVAWVREFTDRPVGNTGFFEAQIWVVNSDGSDARAVNPKSGMVQDAPSFEPVTRSTRLVWSELNPATIGQNGPQDYGIWLHDLAAFSGRFVCQGASTLDDGTVARCFGQHVVWRERSRIVLPQQMLEIDVEFGPVTSHLDNFLGAIASQVGTPERTPSPSGFFPGFPLSASYIGDVMLIDGVFVPLSGDYAYLGFFFAGRDGSGPTLITISGRNDDLDAAKTAGYLFSLATPQLVP